MVRKKPGDGAVPAAQLPNALNFGFWSRLVRKTTLPVFGIATLLLAVCMTGCGGGTNFGLIVNLSTSPAPTIDQGQVVTVKATIVNDSSNKGVTWSLSGLGSLSNATPTSVTYVAPSSVTGTQKATITATSVANTSVMTSTAIQVNPPPTITTTSLPAGTAGTCYGQTSTSSGVTCNGEALSETGGTAPYTWGVIAAGLPPGLSLNPGAGVVTGIPTAPGTYTPTFSVTDAVGLSHSATISMSIAPPPSLTVATTSLPTAAKGVPYSVTLQAAGGVAPYNWGYSGVLPGGLSLSPSGVISGTPAATGTSNFTVQVTDSEGPTPVTVPQALSIIVNTTSFSVSTTALPDGTQGIAYSTTLQTSGGVGPVTWSIVNGSLPGWATLDTSTGVISGPAAAGTSSFTVQATDSNTPADIATQPLSITISATTADSLLKGQYAFSLGGHDGGVVGSFTADGSGAVTTGSEDLVGATTALHVGNVAITSGSYTIGADGRGVLSYTDAKGNTFTFDLALSAQSSITGASTGGAIIETDTSGDNFTGSFALQNSSGFSSAVLVGGYAFGFSGWDASGNPDVVVGSASISSGALSSGLLDENDGGTLSSNVSFAGTLAVDTSGRGTITSGTSGVPQANFVFYVISKTEWYAMAYDTTTGAVRTGIVEQQTGGPYSNASINATMVLQSQSATSAPAPEAEVGLLTSAGTGSASTALDVDQGGNLSAQSDTEALSFTSPGNGRFTIAPQTMQPMVGYMIAPNEAFIEGTGATPSFGTFEPQATGPFSASSLIGSFFVASLPLVSPPPGAQPPTVSSGLITFDAIQNLTGTIDSSNAGTATASELTETYSVASTGRVSISPAGAIMYIVSSSKIIILSTGLANSTNPLIEIAQR